MSADESGSGYLDDNRKSNEERNRMGSDVLPKGINVYEHEGAQYDDDEREHAHGIVCLVIHKNLE